MAAACSSSRTAWYILLIIIRSRNAIRSIEPELIIICSEDSVLTRTDIGPFFLLTVVIAVVFRTIYSIGARYQKQVILIPWNTIRTIKPYLIILRPEFTIRSRTDIGR